MRARNGDYNSFTNPCLSLNVGRARVYLYQKRRPLLGGGYRGVLMFRNHSGQRHPLWHQTPSTPTTDIQQPAPDRRPVDKQSRFLHAPTASNYRPNTWTTVTTRFAHDVGNRHRACCEPETMPIPLDTSRWNRRDRSSVANLWETRRNLHRS